MNTNNFKDLLKNNDDQGAINMFLEQFQSYIVQNKLSAIKNFLNLPQEMQKDVIKVMDLALMERWSRILIRHIYRKQKSPIATIWYCEELIDEHKLIEAEELLKELEKEGISNDIAPKLYFNLAVTLIQMQRFQEGFFYMQKCEQASGECMNTNWAYYYFNKDEWDKALQFLENGKDNQDESALTYALFVQHYSMQGDSVTAAVYLEEGLKRHPYYPKLLLEKIRVHYRQKQWNDLRESVSQLKTLSPYHDYQKMCDYYVAESFYEEEKLDLLVQHLATHPALTKHSHFKHFNGNKHEPIKTIPYKPVVQKYNFCVPACVSMLLSMFSREFSQEEIAESIFDVAGSRITQALAYFEEKGFSCRLFLGNEDRYKQLLDQNAAVMIMIDYPTSAHVQVLAGYDDNLQMFTIQDPNFREPHPLEYQHIQKELGNNLALSVAIVPASQANTLQFLDPKVSEKIKKLLLLTEEGDNQLELESIHFLKEHSNDPIVAVYAVKCLAGLLEKELLDHFIMIVEQHFSDSQYRNLIISMAYTLVKNDQRAHQYLDNIKTKDSAYHYLKGRLLYDHGDNKGAAAEFKEGLKHEPDDYVLWSYLALTATNQGKYREALRLSEIALDINSLDVFPLSTHGMILFDNEKYEEARTLFSRSLKLNKNSAHLWYERARCDKELNDEHKALRGFKTALGLDPKVPLPYRELANLYEFSYEDWKRAEEVLRDGLVQTEDSLLLLQELGAFYERNKEYDRARTYYQTAAEKDPEDSDAFLSLAGLLREEEKITEFFSYLNSVYDRFQDHNDFLINGGKMLWDTAIEFELDETCLAQGLSFLEKGLRLTTANLEEALELYIRSIENTPFYRRGIQFLESECAVREDKFLFISYIGCLYETNGYLEKAKSYYNQALMMKEDILPLYRLGEIDFKNEDYENAKENYRKVLKLDPSHEQAMLNLATIASQEENNDEALNYLMEAFEADPYSVSVDSILELMDDTSMVEAFLQHVQQLDKKKYQSSFIDDSLAYIYGKLGNLKEEEVYLERALADSPEQPQLLYHQVQLLLKKGEYKKAKKECLQGIQKNVHSREWFELLINVYSKTKSMAKLDTDLKKLKLSPKEQSIVFMNSGAAYEKAVLELLEERVSQERMNMFKKFTSFTKLTTRIGIAMKLYETAMILDPENEIAALWFSDFYLQMFLVDDAIKVLEKALQSHWNADLAYKLATLYVNEQEEMSEKKRAEYLTKAEPIMEKLVAENDEPEYMNLLGLIIFLQGRLKEAEKMYLKCLEIEPGVDRGYLNLGRIYTQLGDFPKAELALKKALELIPQDWGALSGLTTNYRLHGKMDEALQWLDHALTLHHGDLHFQYNRACTLSLLGRLEESAQQLKEVFAADEEGVFLNMAMEDQDLLPLSEAGVFPTELMFVK
jgi:tetratricopeptide (TPR) repeat protein